MLCLATARISPSKFQHFTQLILKTVDSAKDESQTSVEGKDKAMNTARSKYLACVTLFAMLGFLASACTKKKSGGTGGGINPALATATPTPVGPDIIVDPPGTGGNPTDPGDPSQVGGKDGDLPWNVAADKTAAEIFKPTTGGAPNYQTISNIAGNWLETTDGNTVCHIMAGRFMWWGTTPARSWWASGSEVMLEVDLTPQDTWFTDQYRTFEGKGYTTVGTLGQPIKVCPVKKRGYIRIPQSNFVALSQAAAYKYVGVDFTLVTVMANQDTSLVELPTQAGQAQQKGTRGCLIPAKTIFSVVFKRVSRTENPGDRPIPVELMADIAGGSGDLCKKGTIGYINAGHAVRVY